MGRTTEILQIGDTHSSGVPIIAPALIANQATASAVRQEVFRPRCKQFNLTGEGVTFAIPLTKAVTFAAITEGTAPACVNFDPSARTLTPALYGVDVIVGIAAWQASKLSMTDMISAELGQGIALHRDSLGAALYTEAPASTPDHEIGEDGTELNFTSLRDGMALLYTQNAPKKFAWVLNPGQLVELLKDDTFINASVKGASVLTKGVGANGYVTSVMDVDVYISDQMDQSSGTGYWSMMFSDGNAIAYGYKLMSSPLNGTAQELLVDIHYNSGARCYEVNSTYHADMEGAKGTTTANNWLVAIKS
jgi:hypothetical protein